MPVVISQANKDRIVQAVENFMRNNTISGEVELVFNDAFEPDPPDPGGGGRCVRVGNVVTCS